MIDSEQLVRAYLGMSEPATVYLAYHLGAGAERSDAIDKDNIQGRGYKAVFESLERETGTPPSLNTLDYNPCRAELTDQHFESPDNLMPRGNKATSEGHCMGYLSLSSEPSDPLWKARTLLIVQRSHGHRPDSRPGDHRRTRSSR
jgi:hypothetical protein